MKTATERNAFRILTGLCVIFFCLTFSACRNSKSPYSDLPENFNQLTIEEKMDTIMKLMPPDSVARFICNAALNKIPNVKIDLKNATLYAYEKYKEENLGEFASAFDNFVDSAPLEEKIRLYKLSATEDPDRLGYQLGLEYLTSIRENGKTAEDIRRELDALKKECKNDPDFYKRFMIGFKYSLNNDRFIDLDDNIYKEFINYEDTIK